MPIQPVEQDDIIIVLDQNYPDWYIEFSTEQQLKRFAQGFITQEGLRVETLRRMWPVCVAVYTAIVIKNK